MDLFTLGLGGALGAGGSYALRKLRTYERQPRALDGLLGYAYLLENDPAVIEMKDGAFLRVWTYRGADVSTWTDEEQDRLSMLMAGAIKGFGAGWTFNVDAIRRPAVGYAAEDKCHFRSPALKVLDNERRRVHMRQENHFETQCYLTATYLPPSEVYDEARKIFLTSRGGSTDARRHHLHVFRRQTDNLERRLRKTFRMQPLTAQGTVTFLHECITGLSQELRVPRKSTNGAYPYLGWLLASLPVEGGHEPRVGDRHVRPVAVQGLSLTEDPDRDVTGTTAGMMSFLNRVPYGFRLSTRWMPLSMREAEKKIGSSRGAWRWRLRGLKGLLSNPDEETQKERERTEDRDAAHMESDAADALAALNSGRVSFGFLTSVLVINERAAERAKDLSEDAVSRLANEGFTARVENVNALDAYLGTLPGHANYNARLPVLSSDNFADAIPTTGVWPGLEVNPSRYMHDPKGGASPALMWAETDGQTPFRVNLHSGTVGHGFCVGRTESGKSVLMGTLAYQWMRYHQANLHLFDVGYSHKLMCMAARGRHYDIGEDPDVQLQPLRYVDDPLEAKWAADWLEILFDLQGVQLTAEDRTILQRQVRLVGSTNSPDNRTLTQLYGNLSAAPHLQAALRPYLGGLLDGRADSIADEGGFQVYEMEHLIGKTGALLVPVQTYLFHRVERQCDGERPTGIIIEEGYEALMSSLFANTLKRWLMRMRKKNAFVFLVVHDPAQLKDDEIRNVEVLTNSCVTNFFLPNANATNADMRGVYRTFGLTDGEIGRIGEAEPRRDYYYKHPDGSRMIQLGLSDAELAFMGNAEGLSMIETIRRAEAMREGYGASWPAHWLRFNGCEEAARRFEDLTANGDYGTLESLEHVLQPA